MTNLMPLFSSKKTEYITPKALFDELDRKHHFVLDPCTREDNPLQTLHYYTKKEDGLKLDWNFGGAIYVNPPYSREIPKWIKKALEQNKKFGITICMLLPARVDTKWFRHYLYNKEPRIKICFLEGRLKFRDTKHSATFPSMIVTIYPELCKKESTILSDDHRESIMVIA